MGKPGLPSLNDDRHCQRQLCDQSLPRYSRYDKPLPLKPLPGLVQAPQRIFAPLVLKGGSYCLSTNGEIFTKLDWDLDPVTAAHIAAELNVVDADGKVLAIGPRSEIGLVAAPQLLSN